MAHMSDLAKPSNVDMQLVTADAFARRGEPLRCFEYLERAHVLAQSSTCQHVRVHWLMLRWAIKHRDVPEGAGQVVRIVGAVSMTALGLVPIGNTGGANVNPFRRMPIPADLAALLTAPRSTARAWLIVVAALALILAASSAIGIG